MGESIAVVVDDQPPVAKAVGEQLEFLGFQVATFTDPKDALDFTVKRQEEIFLLVTDYEMPKTNGAELIGEVKKLTTGIKTICMSGKAKNAIPEIKLFDGYLGKPFSYKRLKEEVEKVLPLN